MLLIRLRSSGLCPNLETLSSIVSSAQVNIIFAVLFGKLLLFCYYVLRVVMLSNESKGDQRLGLTIRSCSNRHNYQILKHNFKQLYCDV
jgi:hypothetical protein